MSEQTSHAMWVVAATLLLAFLFAIYPLPQSLLWARPEWVALVLIYWVIALPQRIGFLCSFTAGLLLDVLEDAPFGQNALSLSVAVWLALTLYRRARRFNVWWQSVFVFVMVGSHQMVGRWLQNATGVNAMGVANSVVFWMPVVISALLWPAVMTQLRYLRRRFQVR